ncbi:MAG: ABC transporter substrate-binding protein [Alphaproteobacteria bacterium]|nr:ABC transporter substrate-binding protein [Alphaproteobacteria bacterium]
MKRLALALAAVLALAAPAWAAPPRDMLVMAWRIDDMIGLDPADAFELTTLEVIPQIYDRLVEYDPADVTRIRPMLAESWTVSEDGRVFTFTLRDDVRFHSGASMTAEDVVFSLRRAIKVARAPAALLGQLGWTPATVDRMVRVGAGPRSVVIETDRPYAPAFVLYLLTADVASVLESALVIGNQVNGDLGQGWLKTNSAGSGPFKLRQWKPAESVLLDRHDDYWRGAPPMKRVVLRHIPEAATQRLLLEKGDVDVARNLTPEQARGLRADPAIKIGAARKSNVWYLSLNQKRGPLAKPEVRQAFRHLIDYEAIRSTILEGHALVRQSFLPEGFLGAIDDKPFAYDLDKAKALLAKAGYADGFTVTMDVRNAAPTTDLAQAIQAGAGAAGIRIEIVPGDGKQVLTKYRARNHDLYIGQWSADYQDPHTNADAFAANADNGESAIVKSLAWRNAWDIPEMTKATFAALIERDPSKRAAAYGAIQRAHQADSPFVLMFQEVEVVAQRADLDGIVWGPAIETNLYWKAAKRQP